MTDFSTLNYRDCQAAIADIFMSNAFPAVYVDGPPGCGKTAMARYVKERMNLRHYFIVKPGHHESYEFHGLPVPIHTTKTTDMYPSSILLPPSDLKGGTLIVLDEAGDSLAPVQNLICQWINEGGLHNYISPENSYYFLTGNRMSDKSGAQRIVTKLANRCARFTLQPTVQELFNYGVANGWAASVLAFLKLKGDDPINTNDRKKDSSPYVATYFNSFDPNDPAQSIKPVFASSRTWEAASKLINYIDKVNPKIENGDLLSRVASLLGSPVATAYVPFRNEALVMPDPDAIAAGKNVAYPKKTNVMWVLTISLVTRATKANVETIYRWLVGGQNKEFAILFIVQCFHTKATQLINPAFSKLLQDPDIKQALEAK